MQGPGSTFRACELHMLSVLGECIPGSLYIIDIYSERISCRR